MQQHWIISYQTFSWNFFCFSSFSTLMMLNVIQIGFRSPSRQHFSDKLTRIIYYIVITTNSYQKSQLIKKFGCVSIDRHMLLDFCSYCQFFFLKSRSILLNSTAPAFQLSDFSCIVLHKLREKMVYKSLMDGRLTNFKHFWLIFFYCSTTHRMPHFIHRRYVFSILAKVQIIKRRAHSKWKRMWVAYWWNLFQRCMLSDSHVSSIFLIWFENTIASFCLTVLFLFRCFVVVASNRE